MKELLKHFQVLDQSLLNLQQLQTQTRQAQIFFAQSLRDVFDQNPEKFEDFLRFNQDVFLNLYEVNGTCCMDLWVKIAGANACLGVFVPLEKNKQFKESLSCFGMKVQEITNEGVNLTGTPKQIIVCLDMLGKNKINIVFTQDFMIKNTEDKGDLAKLMERRII